MTVQLALAASVLRQADPSTVNTLLLLEIALTVRGEVPVLVSVTVCGALATLTACAANVSAVGVMAIWALLTPLPESAIESLSTPAPYGTVSVPLRDPANVGEKRNVAVHEAATAKLVLHVVLTTENSALLVDRPPTNTGCPPVLVRVSTGLIVAAVPKLVFGKA